MEHPEVKL